MNNQQESPSARWFRRLFAGIFVIVGIIRMSSKSHMTTTDISLMAIGCIALAWAVWQEARNFLNRKHSRHDSN
ncbi:uncharacterized membrane protein HdeD (DUF308 family) [Streptomyces turgidiscabies]|uniref:Uncharacterized membrane protein HdeD (DUF308 family) n=1 Tax=Streptomyces turgidiscabies TaxID=85558 RepID=A0ABU0RT79_9ACTN|nr:uncharacterized membrane protein HdeD (DUF308 family) [Streptomyces turgidiscabies]